MHPMAGFRFVAAGGNHKAAVHRFGAGQTNVVGMKAGLIFPRPHQATESLAQRQRFWGGVWGVHLRKRVHQNGGPQGLHPPPRVGAEHAGEMLPRQFQRFVIHGPPIHGPKAVGGFLCVKKRGHHGIQRVIQIILHRRAIGIIIKGAHQPAGAKGGRKRTARQRRFGQHRPRRRMLGHGKGQGAIIPVPVGVALGLCHKALVIAVHLHPVTAVAIARHAGPIGYTA